MCSVDTKTPKCVEGFYSSQPSQGHHHVLMAELAAHRYPQTHFTTSETRFFFKNEY